MRVLTVDDDPISAMVVKKSLAKLGIHADHANSGEQALEMHAENPYRLVISDWMMPGIDGIEVCRRLRNLSVTYVYFILCSAKEDRGIRLEAFDAGVDDFLGKPLDRDELRARLQVAHRILASEERISRQRDDVEVSARRMADLNESLKAASRRFEDLFNGIPVACFTFDASGGVHEWNRAAEEAFGIPAYDTLQRTAWEILGSNGGTWTEKRCQAVFRGEEGVDQFDWTYSGMTTPRHFASSMIALRGRSGKIVGALCANVDVTDRKNAEMSLEYEKACLEDANARLHDLAANDGLTGLWNRRSLMIELDSVLQTFQARGEVFSIILLDIDRFKQYNDTFGHPAGDEVLRRFAKVLRSTAREAEKPARYGGEEFAIVLHGAGADDALAAAERFREAVEGADWVEREVTCSLGVSTAGINGLTIEDLIASADAALYASKQNGRNRATHAQSVDRAKAA